MLYNKYGGVNMNKLIDMFISFFKIGAFTFGGGYAMIPIIQAEVVKKKKWISEEEFLDIIVISQSFPGALAVNTSIFIGYKLGGAIGAVMALLGTIIPSFLIILIVASYFIGFRDNHLINLAFKGIGAAVPVLVLTAVISLSKSIKKNYGNFIIVITVVISVSFFNLHPVFAILLSGLYGFLFLRKKVD